MKAARGTSLWVRAGNVRRPANRFETLIWDSREQGQYRKKRYLIP